MLATILNWLSGGIITKLADGYWKHLETKANSTVERERVEAEERIARLSQVHQTNRAAMGSWVFWLVFASFALPVAAYQGQIVVWDTMLGMGVTPPVGGRVAEWMDLIVQYVFPSGAGAAGLTAIASAVARR